MTTAKTHIGAERDRAVGALVGLALGDALGTTLEFKRRDEHPLVTDLVGGGPFGLAPGEWTDDTSMALCLAESILECDRVEPADLMNRFVAWWQSGHNSVTGECFDIGITTSSALQRFLDTNESLCGSTNPNSAGNGSLMRLAPVAIRWSQQPAQAREAARLQSRTTHAATQAVEACAFYAMLLVEAISGESKDAVLRPRGWKGDPAIADIAAGAWRSKTRSDIVSSGYVIHTLEAALWSVGQATSFEHALITAVNLADDADTVGAVTGQLAGALWGLTSTSEAWLAKLAWRDRIERFALSLFEAGTR